MKEWDGDKYHAEFDGNLDAALCTCCMLFVDVAWHTNDTEVSSRSYEWNMQIGGVRLNPDWRPKEKEKEKGH